MRKGTLKLDGLQALVLDEADEMLRMGFIEEVEWILEQAPAQRQMALFSATMPKQIERIARKHLNKPQEISIKAKTATAETIRQRYWLVSGVHKLDALTRILEVEDFDAILIFVRTKLATTQLAEKLEARGYAAAAMNGDMVQKDRERMVERLKQNSLDILVATDVAARGLDVERISLVINYDIPNDTEAYIHRIGRTGRAGRAGDAILFVAPRERRMLRAIESATRQKITELEMPTTETVNTKRIADFKERISATLAAGELDFMLGLLEQYQKEHEVPAIEIAAALAQMSIGDKPLLLAPDRERPRSPEGRPAREDRGPTRRERQSREDRDAARNDAQGGAQGKGKPRRNAPPASDMERFRIEVGYAHGVKPGNIVGAIANEAGLDGKHVGQVEITDTHSFVDLPKGMPKEVFRDLKKVWVCGQQLKISRLGARSAGDQDAGVPKRPAAGRGAVGKVPVNDRQKHSDKPRPGKRPVSSTARSPEPEAASPAEPRSAPPRKSATKSGAAKPKRKVAAKGKPKAKPGQAKTKQRHRDVKAKGKPGSGRKAGAKPS